ncbi:MAG: site-specific DNA-methyltransferase [Armatimonadota bacterium]|jgi:hypothetical protein
MAREPVTWGPDNPHPLSRTKTELVWEGKYDEYGNRRPIRLPTSPLPLQRIETIDEPRDRSHAQRLPFEPGRAHRDDFRNLLIWGDNKLAMASLLEQFRGKVGLIYIDPPFDVGADFTMDVQLGDAGDEVRKEQSILEAVAYRDTWGKNTDSYLHMMYERLTLMRDLLAESGSIYVHCDWHVGSYLRLLLDQIFGEQCFLKELVWYYYNKMHDIRKPIFPRAHDSILLYCKNRAAERPFTQLKEKREKPTRQLIRGKVNGRMVNVRDEEGRVLYRETDERTIDDVWRIPMLQPADTTQNTGFVTQKNELVLSPYSIDG